MLMQMSEVSGHGTRVSIDIQMTPPTSLVVRDTAEPTCLCIVLPLCCQSDRALVLDTRHLSINTSFDWASNNQTMVDWNAGWGGLYFARLIRITVTMLETNLLGIRSEYN